MAIWTMIPDKIEEEETQVANHLGVFGVTLVTFLLAEMGTTLGMLIADVPAVFVGDRFSRKIPMKLMHAIAAAMFAVMGVLALLQVDTWILVEVQVLHKTRNLTLPELRADAEFQDLIVLKKGNRLSITPVKPHHWRAVLQRLGHSTPL